MFSEFYIYSAEDEIYRAIGNVIGTTFVGGMVRSDLTAYWHNGGKPIDIISDFVPDTQRVTKLNNLEVERTIKTVFYEDFYGKGLNTDIWQLTVTGGGTGAVIANQKGGVFRLSSPAVATSDDAVLTWNSINSIAIPLVYEVGAKLNSVDNVYTDICNLSYSNNNLEIYYDSGGANYQILAQSGGVGAAKDSGIAANTNKHIFRIEGHTDGGNHAHFFIDGVETANSPITTNVPTTNLQPLFYINTNNAALKTLDIDYVNIMQNR